MSVPLERWSGFSFHPLACLLGLGDQFVHKMSCVVSLDWDILGSQKQWTLPFVPLLQLTQ
jgi:hypothetical protein